MHLVTQNMQRKHLINMATKWKHGGKVCVLWRNENDDADWQWRQVGRHYTSDKNCLHAKVLLDCGHYEGNTKYLKTGNRLLRNH